MTHKGTATLETDRLILRRFTLDDSDAMFKNWASDPEVTKYLGWYPHESPNATRELLTKWCENYESPRVYNWAIVPRNFTEPIGSIGSVKLDEAAQCIEIGYCMGKAWWRKGIMPEAFAAVIKYLFEKVGVNRIQAGYNPLNGASGAVMRKCGLKCEGTERQSRVYKGKLIDHTFYAILAEEYFGSARKAHEPETSNIAT